MNKTTDIPLKLTWEGLLGSSDQQYTELERRKRWEKWKQKATDNGDEDVVDYWSDHGECEACIHKDGDWCTLMGLPVTVNPYLTMKHNMIGLACMGAGYENQTKMEFD